MDEELQKIIDFENEAEIQRLYKENERLKEENEKLKAKLKPLEDIYFEGLSFIDIEGLARKNIEIAFENRKLETALDRIRQFCGCYSENDIAKPIFEVILNIIDGDSELLPEVEIPF